jgi:hypothetical protein
LECSKNPDIVKLLFKMKDIKRNVMNVSCNIKSLKVEKESIEHYNRCYNLYQEGSCYFFQCCGFLKSQYIDGYLSSSSKSFLLNNLYIPAYKKFLELRQVLSLVHTEEIYKANLDTLKGTTEAINNSMSDLLNEFNIL